MADYFHPALRGEQIHESKIKVLPAGTPMPVPEWEGQLLAVGSNFYYSIFQNNALIWKQPSAFNVPTLPANVVVFEEGFANPPSSRTGSGRIYVNSSTKDIWYLSGSQWIKLGTGSSAKFEIISGRSAQNWQGNYFGLLNPDDVTQDNCLLVKKWEANKYYLVIQTVAGNSLGGSDDNLFYVELWTNYNKTVLSAHAQLTESIVIVNTVSFNTVNNYRLGVYLKRNGTKIYLNFRFNLDTRLISIAGIANISYGY